MPPGPSSLRFMQLVRPTSSLAIQNGAASLRPPAYPGTRVSLCLGSRVWWYSYACHCNDNHALHPEHSLITFPIPVARPCTRGQACTPASNRPSSTVQEGQTRVNQRNNQKQHCSFGRGRRGGWRGPGGVRAWSPGYEGWSPGEWGWSSGY